jgi:putative pre-16S rRNA nuclease
LDVGSKRIGVAVSDGLGLTAQGVETISCKTQAAGVERIVGLAGEYAATEMVVGIPYNMNGTEGPQVEMVREVIELIRQRLDVQIHEWDERLSTAAAERVLLEADVSRSKRRKVVDKLAAVLILQGYLDSRDDKGFSYS